MPLLLTSFFLTFLPLKPFSLWSYQKSENESKIARKSNNTYIYALTSLKFYLFQRSYDFRKNVDLESVIPFSENDIQHLWEKVRSAASTPERAEKHSSFFLEAYANYEKSEKYAEENQKKEAKIALKQSYQHLAQLLQMALSEELQINIRHSPQPNSCSDRAKNNRKNDDSHLSKKIKKTIAPYLIPKKHPMMKSLDTIFSTKRATYNRTTFLESGFDILAEGSRSYIVVARHSLLPGYLFKCFFDSERRKKNNREGWEWLVRRCEGAKKIRDVINSKKIKYFTVPDKWIYLLPEAFSPPLDRKHVRHPCALLTTDMELVPYEANLKAWSTVITIAHLKELHAIMVRANGSSYRPDNIAYTKNGTFAFIDTEYPYRSPDFTSIRKFLNDEMCDYWDWLITNGGPN